MKRKWGATGVGTYRRTKLAEDKRKHITQQLRTDGADIERIDQFLGALDDALM